MLKLKNDAIKFYDELVLVNFLELGITENECIKRGKEDYSIIEHIMKNTVLNFPKFNIYINLEIKLF